jgi:hypothetical protein
MSDERTNDNTSGDEAGAGEKPVRDLEPDNAQAQGVKGGMQWPFKSKPKANMKPPRKPVGF